VRILDVCNVLMVFPFSQVDWSLPHLDVTVISCSTVIQRLSFLITAYMGLGYQAENQENNEKR
jgi:hypothetical protein